MSTGSTSSASQSVNCRTCQDLRWITRNVPVDHPDFGKSFPCPDCYQQEHEQKKLSATLADSGIGERHSLTFADFFQLPEYLQAGKEDAAQHCYDLAVNGFVSVDDVTKHGILLYHRFGVGKTTLGASATIEAARRGQTILRLKSLDYVAAVQDGYSPKPNEPDSDDIIAAAQKVHFLLLDDLGVLKRNFVETDDKVRILHRTLEYRVEHNLPTVITSNLETHQDIIDQFGMRFAERVRELCHRVLVDGEVLRR